MLNISIHFKDKRRRPHLRKLGRRLISFYDAFYQLSEIKDDTKVEYQSQCLLGHPV